MIRCSFGRERYSASPFLKTVPPGINNAMDHGAKMIIYGIVVIILHAQINIQSADAFQPLFGAQSAHSHLSRRRRGTYRVSGIIECSVLDGRRRQGVFHLEMAPPLIQEDLNGDTIIEGNSEQVPFTPDDGVVVSDASTSTSGFTAAKSSRQLPANWFGEKSYILFTATLIGLFTGTNIALFKTSVELVR